MTCKYTGHPNGQFTTVTVQLVGDTVSVTGDPLIAGTYQ